MTQLAPSSVRLAADAQTPRGAIAPIDPQLDLTPFRVRDPWAIVAELQAMVSHAVPVSIYPPHDAPRLDGRLMEVSSEPRRFALEVDRLHAPVSGPSLIVGQPQGIHLQFHADLSWEDQPGPVLRCAAALPEEMVHLQRRHFPRLDAPLGPVLHATFALHGKTRVMNVEDLSLGGLGLRCARREGAVLARGQRLDRVRLDLGQSEPLVVTLDICSRRPYQSFLVGEQLQFGCRYVDLTPTAGAVLQQIVLQFEEERRLRGAPRAPAARR